MSDLSELLKALTTSVETDDITYVLSLIHI